MKSLESSRNIPVESILFPSYKIQPSVSVETDSGTGSDHYRGTRAKMENPDKQAVKEGSKQRCIHLLETTKPNLLLQKIFHPYLILVRIFGSQPLKIHTNGCATFSYLSWNVMYSVMMFSMFILDTAVFLPILMYINAEMRVNYLTYVTEAILVSSQIFAALVSYIFITFQAWNLAYLWNRLQEVVVKLVARCPNHLDLVPSFRSARMKIIGWFLFAIVFGTCYIASFYNDISGYLIKQEYNEVLYWAMFVGFAGYSILLSIHILHSTCFTTYVCVLSSCFQTLGNIATRQDGQGTMRNSQSPLLFHEITQIYEDLVELKTLLGRIYGVHLGLEFLVMIICVTINIFFVVSRPSGFSSLFAMNLAIAMPYLIWFHEICDCCGELNCKMRVCYRSFRRARAVRIATKNIPVEELSPLQVEPPEVLSAAGYFLIDKKLFTSVMGTIATYLVVMLQFAFSSGVPGVQQNDSFEIGNNSTNKT